MVIVEPEQKYRVRVLNGGGEGLALHFHGHKPTLTHRDGVPLPPGAPIQRDVFWIASAQRVDLDLSTVNDGLNAYGAGAWLLHDHREQAVTSNGIGPGGNVSMVVYEDYLGQRGLPQTVGGLQSLAPFFTQAYYAGEMPVFSGMHGHDLLEPAAPTVSDKREWIFWAGVVLLAWVVLLLPLGRWYRQ